MKKLLGILLTTFALSLITGCTSQKAKCAVYCYYNYAEWNYTGENCHCKSYLDMEKDLEDKDIISISCTACGESGLHLHYCVVYRG